MALQEEIFDATDEALRKRMRSVGTTSPAWAGIVAELQRRANDKMHRQTKALVWLTWVIAFLTGVLLFYAVKLDQHSDTSAMRNGIERPGNVKAQQVDQRKAEESPSASPSGASAP
jgi:hypothetical protein